MSTGESRTPISQQILDEACGWFIDCNEGELDTGGRERFNHWLRRSPEHVQAYIEVAAAWEESATLNGTQPIFPTMLGAEGLVESNVVPFDPTTSEARQRAASRQGGRRLPWLVLAVAASVLLVIGIGFLSRRNVYATGVGEQRAIVLDDGSTVELDARSELRVRFARDERRVELLGGQALFQVKKDAARPFIVQVNQTRVRAVGTQFDVYRKAATTTVTVIEGRVAVIDGSAATPPAGSAGTRAGGDTESPIVLSAGEQLTVAPQTSAHAVRADVAAVIAWTQRRLVFEETPLLDVIAEFNRYNSRQMIIEDATLASYHIRGDFEADDPSRLTRFLRDRFEADIREHGNEIRISRQ